MNGRAMTNVAVTGLLKLARLPFDVGTRLLPFGRQPARLAVDRADAAARGLAAAVLGDEALREDARRRGQAAQSRERAGELRDQADQVAESAQDRVQARHREASRTRNAADKRAASRREAAEKRQRARTRSAAQVERRRVRESREVEQTVDEAIEEQAPRARLDALQDKAEAQKLRERALTEADEAQRLRRAAERAKEERKA